MKLDLLEGKSAEDVAEIWREYHVHKDAVSAVIPAEMYEKMAGRFKEFKTVEKFSKFLH
jgi:ATP synthase F1 complex assembly factor 1